MHEKTCGRGSAIAEGVRKKDNNIIIPTYLIISPNELLLGERKEQNRIVKHSTE